MRNLVKQYLERRISRATLIRGLSAFGLTNAVAAGLAESLAPANVAAAEVAGAARDVRGNGGYLFVQQLKAAGVRHYFFNPSTGDAPIFDALALEPSITAIKGIQEGAVVAMADGYARLSGQTAVCSIANVGLPNGMTQLVNSFKDRIPLVLVIASVGQDQAGRDGAQDYDHQETMLAPMTKWYWSAQNAGGIPETVRRAFKFASTAPSGPVFLAIPDSLLGSDAAATVIDGTAFNVPARVRPDADDVDKVARMLIEAKSPLLTVGDELTMDGGEAELFELATLLGLPVACGNDLGAWSRPFPTRHPLYLGPALRTMRFPADVDVRLNLGDARAEAHDPGVTEISIRRDPASLARVAPVDVAIVANLKLATADLIAAVKSIAPTDRLQRIAEDRLARVSAYTAQMASLRRTMFTDSADGSPVTLTRLAVELEATLDKDTIYVNDVDSGKKMDPFLSFGGRDKTYVANGASILGWGMAAAFGAKLARPDKPVVAVLGDGAFMFGGPQPLWSQARYEAPITNIVLNNLSYDSERLRIWGFIGGEQFQSGRDMTCYNGSPDVDFAKASEAFGVEAETVRETGHVRAALLRAQRANAEGRPYLLDIHVQREGAGAASQWYPPFSVAKLRTRQV